ncbi:NAD(P)-dependent oxidoreductase [Nocardia sp. NPDC052566]|uniref:NAD(P)-dependent oxidoreductase n=1 Tax=Nocardia sp. NPDC052566 TaxID=3364330 RepID=UPI0037C8FDEC
MLQATTLDTPDVLVVDDGYLQAKWPYLRDALCRGLTSRDLTVMWVSLDQGNRIRDLPGVAEVPALVVLGIEPEPDDIAALRELAVLAAVTGGAALTVAPELAARNIPLVVGTRGRSQSQAELAMALMLCALRQLPRWHTRMVAQGAQAWPHPSWQFVDHAGYVNGTINGKHIVVLGLDPVGAKITQQCLAFGATVWAVDPNAGDDEFTALGVQRIELDEVSSVADIVVVASGGPSLRLDAKMVERLARRALVVTVNHTGIDLAAVRARALRGELAWATDVYDREPVPSTDPILRCANIVHVPGIAGRTRDANVAVADVLCDNIVRVLAGAQPLPGDCIPAAQHLSADRDQVADPLPGEEVK